MTNTIRWGIIGPGKIARKFATGLQVVPHARLLAVASRSGEKAQEFGAEFDVPYCYDTYEALVQNPEVDVVYIATPHTSHYAHALLCLQHHKAVLCEKPLAINYRQVMAMIGLAQQNGIFFMEALWTKFLPSMTKVLELVKDGTIGTIKSIQADFGFRAEFDPESRLFNRSLGGGSLLDIGIYPLFLATTLLGKPQRLKALANLSPTGADENCGMVLEYPDGAMAVLFSSIVSHTPIQANISGTKGRIVMHARWHAPTNLTVYRNEEEPETIQLDYQGNGYNYEAAEVTECLRAGKLESSRMSHADSLQLMEVMDWVRQDAGIRYPEDE